MATHALERQLQVYGLATAQILYHLPDFPALLQTYVWQDYDLAPKFPELLKFLDFWQSRLDGPIHSVCVAHQGLVCPAQLRAVDGQFTLH